MGEGEILRLWANVWLSPAVLPEEGPGAGFAEFCKGRNWAPTPTHALKRMTILSDRSDEVTDIKIPLIVFASFIAILTFVKAGSTIYNRNHFDFYLFSAAIFVGISVGRTLLWIS